MGLLFPFKERRLTEVLTCSHVMIDDEPIFYVSHESDGLWQFLCGHEDDTEEDALVLTLGQIYDRDRTVAELVDLPCGWYATRTRLAGGFTKWELFEDYDETPLEVGQDSAKP